MGNGGGGGSETAARRSPSPEFVASKLMKAANKIYAADPRVRSVGVGLSQGGAYGFIAVRNIEAKLPDGVEVRTIEQHEGIAVGFIDSTRDPESLAAVIQASSGQVSKMPEQGRHRPLVCGLQIQNFDDDLRTGLISKEQMVLGTLGCFIRLRNGEVGFLSNNHVVAGENRGVRGKDRILQSGSLSISAVEQGGILSDFVRLRFSSAMAHPTLGTARFNVVDAGCVKVTVERGCRQKYLAGRKLPTPHGADKPRVGEKVFKVGRTTGLTRGIVRLTPAVVGPVGYASGPCWFRRSMLIESEGGKFFSEKGDSGAAIVRDDGTGTVIGLLFAGDGTQTWACPIEQVLRMLKCKIL
jgi:hypothetical protein